jgi:L-ascorbate metabolism protein UlaG (beta-lactamase superfamily)
MTISWYGEACFLLESGGIRVLIEPPSKDSGINPPRLKSDILIYRPSADIASALSKSLSPRFGSHRPSADIASALSQPSPHGDESPFIINGPGEYEIKGVNILGIADAENTLYNIEIDGIKVSHLGFLNKDLDNGKMALINEPDVVLIPVGGGAVLDAEKAMKLINKIEPSVAIPMLYNIKGLKIKRAPLSVFLKESGAKESPQLKLTLKKKDLVEEETKIVILEKV